MTPEDPSLLPRETDTTSAAPRGVRASLLALGSAAVLAVYAAGYVRTRPAAERFEKAESRRRLPLPDPTLSHQDTTPAVARVVHPASVTRPKTVHHEAVAKDTVPAPPSVAVAAVPPASPGDSVETAAAPAVPASPALPAAATDSLHPRLKDGRYRSWGYSQHGNIEAEVEIQDGRIVNASVTQCLTAYSCSYVRKLQSQVVERQSPEVDTVSGATQSADAFYYAVFSALAKAK